MHPMHPTYTYEEIVAKDAEIDALLQSRSSFDVTLSPAQARAAREAIRWDNFKPTPLGIMRYLVSFARSYFAQPQFFLLYKRAQRYRMKVVFTESNACVARIVRS